MLLAGGAALVQVTQRGGVVAVALLAGSSRQVGFASLAIGIVLGLTYAVFQSFTVALPHLSEREHYSGGLQGGGSGGGEGTLRQMGALVLAVLLPVAAVAAVTIDWTVPEVFGPDFAGATTAFGPALALLVLAPLSALYTQVSALRVQPHAALVSGLVGVVAFAIVAVASIPGWGATGGTAAALAGGSAAILMSVRMLPCAAGSVLPIVSLAGAAAVLALSFT